MSERADDHSLSKNLDPKCAVDTEVGTRIVHDAGEFQVVARAARSFVLRAVQYLAGEQGLSQFVELGPGYPGNPILHEVGCAAVPNARTLYADNDPVVAAHGLGLLANAQTSFAHADLTDTRTMSQSPSTLRVLLIWRRERGPKVWVTAARR
jgi:hypothetical protein